MMRKMIAGHPDIVAVIALGLLLGVCGGHVVGRALAALPRTPALKREHSLTGPVWKDRQIRNAGTGATGKAEPLGQLTRL